MLVAVWAVVAVLTVVVAVVVSVVSVAHLPSMMPPTMIPMSMPALELFQTADNTVTVVTAVTETTCMTGTSDSEGNPRAGVTLSGSEDESSPQAYTEGDEEANLMHSDE